MPVRQGGVDWQVTRADGLLDIAALDIPALDIPAHDLLRLTDGA